MFANLKSKDIINKNFLKNDGRVVKLHSLLEKTILFVFINSKSS